jgi:glycosyltransferase involved in cell wall biosynthesis
MISIVIPAHNEATLIGECLSNILEGAEPDELELIVVANGCSDDTVSVARSFGSGIRIIETDVPSKNNALNLGDAAARGFPRFFVDADVVLPLDSIRKVARVLDRGSYLAAAPHLRVNLEAASWPVRAYHSVWMQLPYVREAMLGSGVYAVSEAGRARFDQWPDIIADDCMVRLAFDLTDRTTVEDAWFEVTPPRTLRWLIHINIRRRVGLSEMRAMYGDVVDEGQERQRTALLGLALNPLRWPAIAVYAYAKLATVLLYKWNERRGSEKSWKRDETTRGVRS